MTIAVVGAGLAGLSAAWELTRAGADAVVLEAERRAGGVVLTEQRDGFIVEGGPDGFLTAEPDIQELAREIGIGDRLVGQVARGSTMWTGRTLEPIAEGKAAELLGIQSTAPLQAGFTSFAAGMQEIVDALVARLGPRFQGAREHVGVHAGVGDSVATSHGDLVGLAVGVDQHLHPVEPVLLDEVLGVPGRPLPDHSE